MSQYVRNMAKIFDGIRLDNAHNTPIHIAKYMLTEARSANPNIYIMAELFCDSKRSEC
jgi:glycogen debranching enzyme